MSIVKDKEHLTKLQKVMGMRLRAARRAARRSEEDAAAAIGHKGLTQISLAESGERIMPLQSLLKLADFYGVSVDYLLGRLDDPSAEAIELNSAMLAGSVSMGMEQCLKRFTEALGHNARAALMHRRMDSEQLRNAASITRDLVNAMERFKQLNPQFEEDMRGGDRVCNTLDRLRDLMASVNHRHEREAEMQQLLMTEAANSLWNPDDEQCVLPLV